MEERFYKVSEKELLELLEARATMSALDSGGVDNWSWYGESISMFCKNYYSEQIAENGAFQIFCEEEGIRDSSDFWEADIANYELGDFDEI